MRCDQIQDSVVINVMYGVKNDACTMLQLIPGRPCPEFTSTVHILSLKHNLVCSLINVYCFPQSSCTYQSRLDVCVAVIV